MYVNFSSPAKYHHLSGRLGVAGVGFRTVHPALPLGCRGVQNWNVHHKFCAFFSSPKRPSKPTAKQKPTAFSGVTSILV